MDKKEKKERKARISEHINLSNGRFKDHEIEKLESLVENREKLDGTTKTYRHSYKGFDSEDTYTVEEEDTYTFRGNGEGIHIEHNHERHYDDGQNDVFREKINTGREILNVVSMLFGK